MSIKAVTWALKDADVPDPLSHLVLIGLADHTDDDGRGAYPAARKLAEYARCSERTVRDRLRVLEEHGLIRRGDQGLTAGHPANRRPVVWDVTFGVQEMHPNWGAGDAGVHGGASWGAQPRTSGVHAVADKPSSLPTGEKPSKNRPIRAQALPDGWTPTDAHRQLAAELGVDCDLEVEKMRDWALAKGESRKDWDATFRNWLRNAKPRGYSRRSRGADSTSAILDSHRRIFGDAA